MIWKTGSPFEEPQGDRRKCVRRLPVWCAPWAFAAALLQAGGIAGAFAQDTAPRALEVPLSEEFILIPVRIGQADLKLALEPSSFMGVTLNRLADAKRAGISRFEPIRIIGGGAGGQLGLRGSAVRGVPVEIAGARLTSLLMVPHEKSDLAQAFQGTSFDGYIGADLLNRMIVEVNYDEKRIRVVPPDQYVPPKGWSELPLRMVKGSPHLKVTLRFDDHSTEATLYLYAMGHEGAVIDAQGNPQLQPPTGSRQVFIETVAVHYLGRAARIRSLELGSWSVPGPILTFPGQAVSSRLSAEGAHGYLGPEILRRFNFALDFPKRRILMQPNRSFDDQMDFDRCGLSFEFSRPEKALQVAHVLEGSPAQAAGLAVGDLILELNGKPTAALSRYDAYRMLRGRAGEAVRLKYRRGSTVKEAALQKKILF